MRFLTLEEFITHHNKLSIRLMDYVDAPRSNYVRISGDARRAIEPRNHYWLSAASPAARIHFARIIDRVWDEWFKTLPGPFHFVTFVSTRFAFAEREEHAFDLAAHQQEITSAMDPYGFIGMTEPAYYPRWRTAPDRDLGPVVAWHSHIVTLGVGRADLEVALEDMENEESLLAGVPAVDIRALGWMQAKSRLRYSCKMPYRVYTPYTPKKPRERLDRRTGELFIRQHEQSKADMRTGQLAHMVNLLHGRYLDELIFGNGLGAKLVTSINDAARERLHAEERRWNDRFGRRPR